MGPPPRYKQRNLIIVSIHLDDCKPDMEEFLVPFGRKVQKWAASPRGMELSAGDFNFALQPRIICHASDIPARAAVIGLKQAGGSYCCWSCDTRGCSIRHLQPDSKGNNFVVAPPQHLGPALRKTLRVRTSELKDVEAAISAISTKPDSEKLKKALKKHEKVRKHISEIKAELEYAEVAPKLRTSDSWSTAARAAEHTNEPVDGVMPQTPMASCTPGYRTPDCEGIAVMHMVRLRQRRCIHSPIRVRRHSRASLSTNCNCGFAQDTPVIPGTFGHQFPR